MKRYKIDFNNGKVFEVSKKGDCFLFEEPEIILSENDLDLMGATITEIEEPERETAAEL
jgi:hypothetical protein